MELSQSRLADADAGDFVFVGIIPRSEKFNVLLKKARIDKVDKQGRFVDFHSLRHTFCTNLHRVGVPQREAMELMRHNDPRLTANTYSDASLFALRGAVERLPWVGPEDDAQRDAQKSDFAGLSPSLAGAVNKGAKSENLPVNMGLESLADALWHKKSNPGKWLQRQGSGCFPALVFVTELVDRY
jgi:hypothetical protein